MKYNLIPNIFLLSHKMKFLTPEQKKFYDDNGYVVIDVLTKEQTDELSRDYDDIFKRKADSNLEATWQGDWNKKAGTTVSVLPMSCLGGSACPSCL